MMLSDVQYIPVAKAHDYVCKCMAAIGTAEDHAHALADVLVTADLRGHLSHGLNRLHIYVNDVKSGVTAKDGRPVTVKESISTAMVDGKNCLGAVVGIHCMKIAIDKARKCGIGWVVARGSNHYGIAGFYAMQAMKEGMVGYSFTNSTPCLQPTRAKSFTLGSNAISCATPGLKDDGFVLDMASSTVAFGKVEVHKRKGVAIPNGWGTDIHGCETTDPAEVLGGGGLLPLGGSEESGSYKGYALATMVEMMCGIMGGAAYGPHVRKWGTTQRLANLGQCFIAVNPAMFCDGFEERMQNLIDMQRELDPMDPDKQVLVAGDPEKEHMKNCDVSGIPYPVNIIKHLNETGKPFDLHL